MEPLDLSKRPPRAPRAKLDGLMLLPRTIDKLRATLPGGIAGDYRIPGMSGRLLEWLGVDEDAIRTAVAQADTDDDVARWLREHTDASAYPKFNDRIERRTVDDIPDKTRFNTMYPWWPESGLTKVIDIIEEDDRRMFGGRS